ncbi:MAG TPA: hypothetical protein PLB87_03050, partial [Prolixibacteraceae bacterium]|nr:hypothetical protein [Prolixibacteraceae bacterium]
MKKTFFLSVAIFAFFIQLNAQQTYTVVVPEGTNACFIAGEMNNWSQMEMNRVSEQIFSFTIDNATPTHLYKYCSGPNWSFVEKDSLGN